MFVSTDRKLHLGRNVFFQIILVFLLVLLFAPNVTQAVTISPARVEIEGEPGNVFSGKVVIVNDGNETQTYYTTFENFEALGESGTPNFVPSSTGLASWIEAPQEITLKPKEETEIRYRISVPETAEPGGHFAAIFWSTTPPDATGAGQVSVSARIGMLILLSLGGEFEEGGGIIEFDLLEGKRFINTLPATFFYRFQNGGADRLKPEGTIEIRNTLRFKDKELDANPSEGNVLPRSIRRFEVNWGEAQEIPKGFFKRVGHQWHNFALGWYTAKLSLGYGEELVDRKSISLFVLPWQLLSVILIVLLILFFIFKKFIRGYNRRIIAKAQAISTQTQETNTEN